MDIDVIEIVFIGLIGYFISGAVCVATLYLITDWGIADFVGIINLISLGTIFLIALVISFLKQFKVVRRE